LKGKLAAWTAETVTVIKKLPKNSAFLLQYVEPETPVFLMLFYSVN